MSLRRRPLEDALQQGARKRPYVLLVTSAACDSNYISHLFFPRSTTTDPLVHRGRHFGRAVYAFANVKSLIMNGLERMVDGDTVDPISLSAKYVFGVVVPLFCKRLMCPIVSAGRKMFTKSF